MNFKILTARHNDENYKTYLEPSLKKIGINKIYQIMDKPDEKANIFIKYASGIEALLKTDLLDDDICVFIHEDVGIVDPFFKQKLEIIFSEKTDVGLVGIVGTSELTEDGGWWNNTPEKLRGRLIQGKDTNITGDGYHLIKGQCGYFDDLIMVDGLFMCTTGKIIKEGLNFDIKTFDVGNDMYDLDFSYSVLKMGYKICIADILLYHKSQGMGALTTEWQINHTKMLDKIKNDGHIFPLISADFPKKANSNKIIEIEI